RTFEDKPDLKEALVGGKVSVSKLAKVASIATKENQAELATLAEIHSREVLETMARDEKLCSREQNKQEKLFEEPPKLNPSLSKEVIEELNRLHEQKQDVNEILLDLLKQRNQRTEEKIQETHERLSGETHPPAARYKNKETRNLLHEKYGKKCAHLGCNRPAEQVHHKVPFSLQSLHDPAFMVPLCKEHHRIAHTIDLKFAEHLHNAQQTTPRSRDPYEGFSMLD
ncbi:MAG: HNH endonuclease, partial [Candidatus Gracilibacteria bacterium]